jgi:hypothetical protein
MKRRSKVMGNGVSKMEENNARPPSSAKPIAEKIIARIRQSTRRKVVNIGNVIRGRAMAEDLQKTIASQQELARLHPAQAVYVLAQNQVSVLSQQLTALKWMAPFTEIVTEAENLYMPSAPPMSPLTTSFFTCWAFFDACAGPASETIGTTILEVGAACGMHPDLLRLIRVMQESRMGFYIHRGREGDLSILEDLVTGDAHRAIVPAGYSGRKGEIWYVRILPPPLAGGTEHVVFTAPYLVLHPAVHDWMAYFRRALPATALVADYELHMKYGPTRNYWNDYVFEAYVNHRPEVIFLAGLPDDPESRPHSRVSEAKGWKVPDIRTR